MQIHFWTQDIDAAISFYTQTLGFTLDYVQPDGGPFDFCILSLNGQEVMFGISPEELAKQDRADKKLMKTVIERMGQVAPLSIYFAVPNINAHYATAQEKEATILETLWSPPWGAPQYSLQDMDGNLLSFHGMID